MSADIVALPYRYPDSDDGPGAGPTGSVLDDIQAEEDHLNDLLDGFPFGSQFDPRAGVSKRTLMELRTAAFFLRLANALIGRSNDREAKYSCDNGWPMPR